MMMQAEIMKTQKNEVNNNYPQQKTLYIFRYFLYV